VIGEFVNISGHDGAVHPNQTCVFADAVTFIDCDSEKRSYQPQWDGPAQIRQRLKRQQKALNYFNVRTRNGMTGHVILVSTDGMTRPYKGQGRARIALPQLL
jgi:hypothetical protein